MQGKGDDIRLMQALMRLDLRGRESGGRVVANTGTADEMLGRTEGTRGGGNGPLGKMRWKGHCEAGLKGLVSCKGGEGVKDPSEIQIVADMENNGKLGR